MACLAMLGGTLRLRSAGRLEGGRPHIKPFPEPSSRGDGWLSCGHWGFGLGMRQQVFGWELGVEDQVEEADHHFVGVLLAPDYRLGGVGIFGVVGGVVEVRGALDFCAFGQSDGLGRGCTRVASASYRRELSAAFAFCRWGIRGDIRNLCRECACGDEAQTRLTSWRTSKVGVDAVVGISGRNLECAVDGGERQHAFFRRLFGEDDADAGSGRWWLFRWACSELRGRCRSRP